MARLHLINVAGMEDSGRWISEMAAKVAHAGLDAVATGDPPTVVGTNEFQGFYQDALEFDPSIADAEEQEGRSSTVAPDGAVYVQFHFDRTIQADDDKTYRIVNVVIPDFTTKLVRGQDGEVVIGDDGVPEYDLTVVAEEAFGYQVRAACE